MAIDLEEQRRLKGELEAHYASFEAIAPEIDEVCGRFKKTAGIQRIKKGQDREPIEGGRGYINVLKRAGPLRDMVPAPDKQYSDSVQLLRSGLQVSTDDSGLAQLLLESNSHITNKMDCMELLLYYLRQRYSLAIIAESMGRIRHGSGDLGENLALIREHLPDGRGLSHPRGTIVRGPVSAQIEATPIQDVLPYTLIYERNQRRNYYRMDNNGRIGLPKPLCDIALIRQGIESIANLIFYIYLRTDEATGVPYLEMADNALGEAAPLRRSPDNRERISVNQFSDMGFPAGTEIVYVGCGSSIRVARRQDYANNRTNRDLFPVAR